MKLPFHASSAASNKPVAKQIKMWGEITVLDWEAGRIVYAFLLGSHTSQIPPRFPENMFVFFLLWQDYFNSSRKVLTNHGTKLKSCVLLFGRASLANGPNATFPPETLSSHHHVQPNISKLSSPKVRWPVSSRDTFGCLLRKNLSQCCVYKEGGTVFREREREKKKVEKKGVFFYFSGDRNAVWTHCGSFLQQLTAGLWTVDRDVPLWVCCPGQCVIHRQ